MTRQRWSVSILDITHMPTILKCRVTRARILLRDTNESLVYTPPQASQSRGSDSFTKTATNQNGVLLQDAKLHSGRAPLPTKQFGMFCRLKFGQEEKESELFTQEDSIDADPASRSQIWQGRLQNSFFNFEMVLDDEQIQLRSLEIKVCEQGDSQDASLGLVQLDLSPLMFKETSQRCDGWFPIYSVEKGITGELFTQIQLDFEADLAKEHQNAQQQTQKQISFFSSKGPTFFEFRQIIGFVEELVDFKLEKTDLDDQIALQEAVLRLRRRLGEIVKKKNGNAIITYRQSVEHTGDHARRVVLRGYGTAALVEIDPQAHLQMLESQQQASTTFANQQVTSPNFGLHGLNPALPSNEPTVVPHIQMDTNPNVLLQHAPNFKSLYRNVPRLDGQQRQKIQLITTDTIPGSDYEQNFSIRFGCAVSARAVRKLSSHHAYEQAQQKRLQSMMAAEWNQWWGELRSEINKSVKQLNCTHVLGYREEASIHHSMCIFTASGTAVRAHPVGHKKSALSQIARYVQLTNKLEAPAITRTSSASKRSTQVGKSLSQPSRSLFAVGAPTQLESELRLKKRSSLIDTLSPNTGLVPLPSEGKPALVDSDKSSGHGSNSVAEEARKLANELKTTSKSCKFCHIVPPKKKYPQQLDGSTASRPQRLFGELPVGPNMHKCLSCGERYVPEIIIATINPPDGLMIIGSPQMIEARAIKQKRLKGKQNRHHQQEQDLMELSNQIFLIEYALHSQLLSKLKLAGKNALFCYRTSIKVNGNSITGLATGTAVCLQALPLTKPIQIKFSPHLEEEESALWESTEGLLSNSEVFKMIESFSRHNIRRVLTQSIVSIQSPYSYVRDLPKKRVIESLITVAESQRPTTVQALGENQQNPIKINVRAQELELPAIPEILLEGKSQDPKQDNQQNSTYSKASSSIAPIQSGNAVQKGPSGVFAKGTHNLQDFNVNHNEISCEINSSLHTEEEAGDGQVYLPPNEAKTQLSRSPQDENHLVVLVQDATLDSPPKRVDFQELCPDKLQSHEAAEIGPQIQIRPVSRSELCDMQILLGNAQTSLTKTESPAVLVLRKEKRSFDADDMSQQLEAETYKLEQLLPGGTTAWTKTTLLKENLTHQLNRRGQSTLTHFSSLKNKSKASVEDMVRFYNQNENFQPSTNTAGPSLSMQREQSVKGITVGKFSALGNLPMSLEMGDQEKKEHRLTITKNIRYVNPGKPIDDNCTLQMILQINDQNDVEQLKTLVDPIVPPEIVFLSSYYDLINYNFQRVSAIEDTIFYARMFRLQMVLHSEEPQTFMATSVNRMQTSRKPSYVTCDKQATQLTIEFNRVMQRAYQELATDLMRKKLTPCVVCCLRVQEKVHEDGTVDVFFTGIILKNRATQPHFFLKRAREEAEELKSAQLNLPKHLFDWVPEDLNLSTFNSKQLLLSQNLYRGSQQASRSALSDGLQLQRARKNNLEPSAQIRKREASAGGFFSKLCCALTRSQPRTQYQQYSPSYQYRNVRNVSNNESIHLIPMSVFPGMNILENFGLVDVNLIRRVYLPEDMLQSLQRGADLNRLPGIEQVTEDIVADLNEIVRTRVRSLGGNCLIGYKISINGFEQILEENKVYLIMSAIGDAVFLESEPTLTHLANSSETSFEMSDKHADFRIEEEKTSGQLRGLTPHNH